MNYVINETSQSTAEMTSKVNLIHDGKEVLRLLSRFIGFFSVIIGEENMNIQHYLVNNSPGLMFPYIREHVSSITQKSGIKPILLPPLNVVALIKGNEASN